uniref:Putative septin n=1 Tax=Culex tarsalis TaxID=7177 RepID=A0A1Q3F6W9_CULTA
MSSSGSPARPEQQPEVYFGTPTMEELKQYYQRLQQRSSIPPAVPPSDSSEESSFELDDSFRAMIERKRKKMIEERLAAALDSTTEDEENGDSLVVTERSTDGGGGDSRFRCNDSTIIEQDSIHKTTDESFEAMERLCGSINLGAGGDGFGEESQLDAEMPPPSLDYTVPVKRASSKGESSGLAEMTQLEDVEEPSGMWENSMLHATAANKMLSPIKRVHMLRPSTILEEATINETTTTGGANQTSSKNTSLESYATAKQQLDGSGADNYSIITGSEVYRTAEEGSTINSTADSSAGVGFETTVVNKTSIENPQQCVDEEVVIVLDSSSSEAEDSLPEGDKRLDASSMLETSTGLQENSLCQNDTGELEDRPESPLLDEIPDHFNDTMEEMEFMMRQGMKVMQQQKQAQELEKSKKAAEPVRSILKKSTLQMTPVTPASPGRYLKPKQPTSASSAKQMLFSHSASKTNSAHKPPLTPSGSSSCGTFKKPLVSRFPLPKSAKKFDHIKSPIGTYINKTPHTTLQAKIFCPNQNLVDVLHTNPHNRESVHSVKENNFAAPAEVEGYSSSLPRKGVICSRGAHVLDERKTVRIPGGEKVHKLLTGSPTLVIRHEGRLRYQRETPLTDDSVADDSVADLSMVSGDVSVRIVKDVRRF